MMLSKYFCALRRDCPRQCRLLSTTSRRLNSKSDDDDPRDKELNITTKAAGSYQSPWNLLKEQVKSVSGAFSKGVIKPAQNVVPRETDVLIIGGGLVGNSVAYWLKKKNPKLVNVTIVERDFGYTRASSMLSAGGIRHQFSLQENIEMSMFTTEFIRNIREHLSVLDHEPPDVQFNHQGYLFLATQKQAENLEDCVNLQRKLGAKTVLLTPAQIAEKFPWINLEDVVVGSYGPEGEGWFDPWLLLKAFRQKNVYSDVKYSRGEVIGFENSIIPKSDSGTNEDKKVLSVANIKDLDGNIHQTKFAVVINCAGAWAGEVAKMAGIGATEDDMPLPVEPRKRFIYVVHCPSGPGLEAPLCIDTSGAYFRREGLGGCYICGCSPEQGKEPDVSNLDVDYEFYDNVVWPRIAYRFPQFEKSKLRSAWAGYYDYNYVDQNLIIGPHPEKRNFIFANGMSGHGVQQSVAIGCAISELFFNDEFSIIDLNRFRFDRFFYGHTLKENYIV